VSRERREKRGEKRRERREKRGEKRGERREKRDNKLGPNPRWETLKRKSSDSKDDENFNVSVQFR
jgi:hypothetical protein